MFCPRNRTAASAAIATQRTADQHEELPDIRDTSENTSPSGAPQEPGRRRVCPGAHPALISGVVFARLGHHSLLDGPHEKKERQKRQVPPADGRTATVMASAAACAFSFFGRFFTCAPRASGGRLAQGPPGSRFWTPALARYRERAPPPSIFGGVVLPWLSFPLPLLSRTDKFIAVFVGARWQDQIAERSSYISTESSLFVSLLSPFPGSAAARASKTCRCPRVGRVVREFISAPLYVVNTG